MREVEREVDAEGKTRGVSGEEGVEDVEEENREMSEDGWMDESGYEVDE